MTPFVIVSAFKAGYPLDRNMARHGALRTFLESSGMDFMEVDGCYKGERERSLLVNLYRGTADPVFEDVCTYAGYFGQESVLHVSESGYAYLFELGEFIGDEPEMVYLGRWAETDAATAAEADAYTEADGRFWVVEPEARQWAA